MKRITTTQQPQQEVEQLPSYLINDSEIAGYESTELQRSVYDFAIFGLLGSGPVSILDFGSGRGDLLGYLTNDLGVTVSRYIAVDNDPVRVDIANKKYGINTELVNVLDPNLVTVGYEWYSDWVFCIQTLHQPYGDHSDKWNKLNSLIENAIHFAKEGIVLILNHHGGFDGESFPIPNVVDSLCEYRYRFAVDFTEKGLAERGLYKVVIFK